MGLDLGLEATKRFRIRACIEKNPAFCETIRANKRAGRLAKDLQVFEGDISDFDPLDILRVVGIRPGQVDVVVGGPPCQSFSTAGRRRTTSDPRGTLLWQFLRFVAVMRPKFFLMENVRGLLSAALRHRPIADRPDKGGAPLQKDERPGSVVELLAHTLQRLRECSYHMDCFEVNAVNYGAPQIRERALFIGNRYNAVVEFPTPTHGPGTNPNGDGLIPWRSLGDAISGLHEDIPVVLDFSPRKKRYLAMVPEGGNWRSLPEDIQKESMGRAWHAKGGRSGWWRRLSLDLPCPTLVTMPNHASTSLCHPTEVRALSLGEYARIQEFPDGWELCGTTARKYEQVGNAVPVRLGGVSGRLIAGHLDKLRKRRWRAYPTSPEAYRVVYIQAHVRTRRWYRNGKIFVRTDGGATDGTIYSAPKTVRKTTLINVRAPRKAGNGRRAKSAG